MEIELAAQRIFVLEERLTLEEIQQRAMDRRSNAFASGIGGLLQRPKAEDIALVGTQRRLEPFWHVAGRARYVYDRQREYSVAASATEVREVTVNGLLTSVTDSAKAGRSFVLPVTEHCVEELAHELFMSGTSGTLVADGAAVVTGPRAEVADPATLSADETIVVPPEHRASFVVRTLLGEMLKPVHADTVHEESMVLEVTDLYYRPVWAFEFHWKPKDKRAVIDIDAVTGQTNQAQSLAPSLSRVITRDHLFDIGADTVGLLVPGGSIAVKVARIAYDQASKSST